jgi:hypothetical protein
VKHLKKNLLRFLEVVAAEVVVAMAAATVAKAVAAMAVAEAEKMTTWVAVEADVVVTDQNKLIHNTFSVDIEWCNTI